MAGSEATIRRLPLDQQDLAEFEAVAYVGGPDCAAGSTDAGLAGGIQKPKGFGRNAIDHTPMVGRARDADNSDAHWSKFLTQRSPQVGQGALITSQTQGLRLECKSPTLTGHIDEPLQLTKVYSLKKGFVEVTAIPLKSRNQPPKQLLSLLIAKVKDVPEGVHNRIYAAQPIQIPLPEGAPALRHQLLYGRGESS